jgi:threonine synthase
MAGLSTGYACYRCGASYGIEFRLDGYGCPACRMTAPSNLFLRYEVPPAALLADGEMRGAPSLWRFEAALPFSRHAAVSLNEGLTPLRSASRLGRQLGLEQLYIKDESANPTWSHKDRFSTVAVTAAIAAGAKVVATASTGNAGASLAAYAARAGLDCIVATTAAPSGAMVSQMQHYGAHLYRFAHKQDRWRFLAHGVEHEGWFATSPYRDPVIGSHPVGIEGYKTMAFEIVEQLGGMVPDWCVLPVCYGDAMAGLWRGMCELKDAGFINRLPRLLAAEVYGSLEVALRTGQDWLDDRPRPFETLAASVGASRSSYQALAALRESRGAAICVGNDGLTGWQAELARCEGLFAELSSVMPLVAISKARAVNLMRETDTVIAVVTASGLKDLDRSAGVQEAGRCFASLAEAVEQCSRDTKERCAPPTPAHQ